MSYRTALIGIIVGVGALIWFANLIGMTWWVAVVFFLIYFPVVELEEQHLRKLFPEYAEYASRVPKLIPRWSDTGRRRAGREARPTRTATFRWAQYRHNREYEAAAGFLIGIAALCWKVLK